MTDAAKRVMLTSMTNENDADVLSAYLDMARDIVVSCAFPYGDGSEAMPQKYDPVQVRIAAYMLNKRGAEGETVHQENGVSRHYEHGDIPLSILREITPYVGTFSQPDGSGV